jgi:hypothetical protein
MGTELRAMRGTVGRQLLLFQTSRDADQNRVLRLFDPVTEKDSWKRSLPRDTDWKMADDQRIVLFGGKKVVVVHADTGEVILEDEIDAGPAETNSNLQLSAFSDGPRLFLTSMRAVPGQNSWPVSPSNNLRLSMVHGWVRAYDVAKKKMLWNRDIFNRSLITAPGQDLPVLVAVGNRMIDLGENRKRLATDVELIDKATGKILASQQHDSYGTMLELVSSRRPPTIELRGYNLQVRFLFDPLTKGSSAPDPPSPEAKTPAVGSPFLQRFMDRARKERQSNRGESPPPNEEKQ